MNDKVLAGLIVNHLENKPIAQGVTIASVESLFALVLTCFAYEEQQQVMANPRAWIDKITLHLEALRIDNPHASSLMNDIEKSTSDQQGETVKNVNVSGFGNEVYISRDMVINKN